MLSPTQLLTRYNASTTTVERTKAAQVDPTPLARIQAELPNMGRGELGKTATAQGDPHIRLADLTPTDAQDRALEALIRPFTLKLAEIDVSPCSRMDLRHIGKVLEPVAEAKALADGLKVGAELARVAQINTISGGDPKTPCVRALLQKLAAAPSLFPLNRSNPKLRTPGMAIEEQLATGKPAKVGLSGSMGGSGGTGKLKAMGAGTPNANPVNAYSGIGVNGQVNGNAALGTRNNSLAGAAKTGGTVVSNYNLAEALDEAIRQMLDPIFAKRAAAGATFKQNTSYDPICPHCDKVMYEKHFVPDREESGLWRHRGDCYDKGAFPIVWPDQHERDAETKKMLSWLSDKQASGDMLAYKAWLATGLSPEEADRKAGESLALPGDKCHHCGKSEGCRSDDTCHACGKMFWGDPPEPIGVGDGDGGYWAKEGERCQHCFALHERGDDGKCNSCGKEHDHPDYLAKKASGVATPQIVRSYAKQAFVTGITVKELQAAAAECEANPTDAQKKSGNYKKGHIRWKGLPITIETAKGYTRSGTDGNGKPWSITMKDHYGYIKNTESEADGDHIDVFLCEDNLDSDAVFIVDQFVDGKFDEHKCILGCENEEQARKVYLRNYADGWDGLESVCSCTIAQFKWWLAHGDTSQEIEGDLLAKNTRKKAAMSPPIEVRLDRLRERRGETPEEFDDVTRDAMQHLERVLHVKFAGPIDSPLMAAQELRFGTDDPLQHILGAQHLSNFLNAGKNRAYRGVLARSVPKSLQQARPELKFPAGPPVPPALPMPQHQALIQ